MGHVIELPTRNRIAPLSERLEALIGIFAQTRRVEDDVFWLKENAEVLNIFECTGQTVNPQALGVHESFYATAFDRLQFFPQYYRFLLSMALDLEDLGLPGRTAEQMVDFAARQGLADAELSDLQRAEARRLMTRRGVDPIRDDGLNDRLRAFASRSKTFALPNKKAAYELTHIVYYLSEYGRRSPDLPTEAICSLHFAGLTAFLEQNADLLAEVCIALLYAGETPPLRWTHWLGAETRRFEATCEEAVSVQDDYHEFLVCNWHAAASGAPVFRLPLSAQRTRFDAGPRLAPLRDISLAMLGMDDQRCSDWRVMRGKLAPLVTEDTLDVIDEAAHSSPYFDAYFEGFARAGRA